VKLSDRQIEKLQELAKAEEHHAILARGMLDAREADFAAGQRLQANIQRLRFERRHSPNAAITESIDAQIGPLETEYARTLAANQRRQQTATDHVEIAGSLTATIDTVCAHAGTSRRALGINFFRDDPNKLRNLRTSPV
jgi:hypothetical protein